jgi:hypothetical protein
VPQAKGCQSQLLGSGSPRKLLVGNGVWEEERCSLKFDDQRDGRTSIRASGPAASAREAVTAS